MTVITGETGAGKSMPTINSIKMILGAKTDTKIIRNGCENAYVEAIFSQNIKSKLAEDILENYEVEEGIIFARKISVNKKSGLFKTGKPSLHLRYLK